MAGKKRKYTIIVEDVDDENVAEEPRHSSTATTTIAADTTPSSAAVEHTDPIVEELAQVRRLVDAIEARESRQVSQNATAGTSTATAEQAIADIKPVVEEFEHDVGDSDCIITEVRQVRRSNRQAVKRLKQFKQEEINQEHRASTPSQPQPVSVTAATPAQKNPTAPAFESGIETISGHENGVTATPPVAIESKTDRSKRRAKRLQSLMLATAESIAGDPATDNATSSPSSPSATVTSHLVQEDDAQNDTDNSSDEESGWETMSDSDEQHAAERTITYLTNYKRLPASALANRAHIIFDKGNTSSSNYNIPDSEKWLPDIIVSAIKMYSVRALNHFLSRNFKKFWFSCLMFITDHKRLSYSISRDNDIVEVSNSQNYQDSDSRNYDTKSSLLGSFSRCYAHTQESNRSSMDTGQHQAQLHCIN